jgi:Helix-turn-helix of insertion element transposase
MSKLHEKSKFIEYLRETPLVNLACKKVGISRATYYRWYKDDRQFREDIQKVIRQGRANINDLAEATLIKMIKGENFHAIRFWLQHNNSRYVPVRTTYIEPPKHDHVNLKPGETCTYCGTTTPKPLGKSGGFYEREIEENQITFAKEAKKKRKLSGAEKRKAMQELKLKQEGIELYERLEKIFPDHKGYAEKIRDGTVKYERHNMPISTREDKLRAKKGKLFEDKDEDKEIVEDVLEL